METGFAVGHVRGIEIRLNWSVVVIAALMTWSLADGVLPEFAEGQATGTYWIVASVLSVALLLSLVAHELGHSLVAAREGVVVERITLWLFGGVAHLTSSPTSPQAALRIAAAGPIVSVAIGMTALTVSLGFDGLAGVAIAWYGTVNVILAVFNLLPAFPMDGGRIYQAWLWSRSGDELESTRRAARVGHRVGGGLVVLGLLEVFFGGAIGGLWLVLIGWFVREAAEAESQRASLAGPLGTIPVSAIMSPSPQCVSAGTSVESFVSGMVMGGRHAAYPLVDDTGRLIGLVTVRSVRTCPRDQWASTVVDSLAVPRDRLTIVAPTTKAAQLLDALGTSGDARAVVMDGEHLAGIISPSDVTRFVAALELAPDLLVEAG